MLKLLFLISHFNILCFDDYINLCLSLRSKKKYFDCISVLITVYYIVFVNFVQVIFTNKTHKQYSGLRTAAYQPPKSFNDFQKKAETRSLRGCFNVELKHFEESIYFL